MDGRDIGTVVFPFAELKVFMKADPEERAKRRLKELLEQGKTTTLQEVLTEMLARDKADEERSTGPLKQADDAVLVDTTFSTAEEVLALLIKLSREAEERAAQ
jgi:cytidylate kinase